jgi:hypothetical protein
MASVEKVIEVYEELADGYARQGLEQLRDRFLVLAADAALAAGKADEAERIRVRLLEHNPHHLLKPFASLAEALKTPDVQNYVSGLRRGYPPESAASLLETLRSGKPGPDAAESRPPTIPQSGGRQSRAPRGAELEDETLRFPTHMPAGRPAGSRPSSESTEPPPIYAVQDPAEGSKGRAEPGRRVPKEAQPAPAVKQPSLRPVAPARAAAPPPASPSKARPAIPIRPVEPARHALGMDSAPSARARAAGLDDADLAGAWVPGLLFVLLLLAALGLGLYTLAAPFVRPG